MEYFEQMEQLIRELDASIKSLRHTGNVYAQAERDYKILLRQECLKLREEGMAIGMIDKTCFGIPSVAQKRFERDIAQTIFEANKESIQATKLKMRIISEIIAREYNNA